MRSEHRETGIPQQQDCSRCIACPYRRISSNGTPGSLICGSFPAPLAPRSPSGSATPRNCHDVVSARPQRAGQQATSRLGTKERPWPVMQGRPRGSASDEKLFNRAWTAGTLSVSFTFLFSLVFPSTFKVPSFRHSPACKLLEFSTTGSGFLTHNFLPVVTAQANNLI